MWCYFFERLPHRRRNSKIEGMENSPRPSTVEGYIYNLKIPPKTMPLLISFTRRKETKQKKKGKEKKYKQLTEKHQEFKNALMLYSCTSLLRLIRVVVILHVFFFLAISWNKRRDV